MPAPHDGDTSDSDADIYNAPLRRFVQDGQHNDLEPKVRRIIKTWVQAKGEWETNEDIDGVTNKVSEHDNYAYQIIRWVKKDEEEAITTIEVRSQYLIRISKEVMASASTIAWGTMPVKFNPEELLVFHPQFQKKLTELDNTPIKFNDDVYALRNHLRHFVLWLELEFQSTLEELRGLLKENQITFPLLWGVCPLGSILYSLHHVTGEPCAMRLLSVQKRKHESLVSEQWILRCEFVDFFGPTPAYAERFVEINEFKGVTKTVDLTAYPLHLHPNEKQLREDLIKRGRRRHRLAVGVHVMHHDGIAFYGEWDGHIPLVTYKKVYVMSRIITDRESFALHAQYPPTTVYRRLNKVPLSETVAPVQRRVNSTELPDDVDELSDEEALLVCPNVYGFSLSHRKWFEFSVMRCEQVTWHKEAFDQLVLPTGQKELVQSLIHNHAHDISGFSDLIAGKGNGLIFNLFGPPGVGKTLTAEATGEYTQMPVYVVGAGDLGTTAEKVDKELAHIFALASTWRAIVLIDEADVFVEQRSLSALDRNAMVSVFLRQIEYFHGILILTTNRVQAFDNAMQSRIDISLHYPQLTDDTKETLWISFLNKAGVAQLDDSMKAAIKDFRKKNFNGRQIKNMVKAANAMAALEDDKILKARHLYRVVGISEDFQSVSGEGHRQHALLFGSSSSVFVIVGLIVLLIAVSYASMLHGVRTC